MLSASQKAVKSKNARKVLLFVYVGVLDFEWFNKNYFCLKYGADSVVILKSCLANSKAKIFLTSKIFKK